MTRSSTSRSSRLAMAFRLSATGASSSNDPFGLGDINQTFYFSPAAAKDFIWGVGPSVSLPTRTTRALGSSTLAIGPAAVELVTPCHSPDQGPETDDGRLQARRLRPGVARRDGQPQHVGQRAPVAVGDRPGQVSDLGREDRLGRHHPL